MKLLGLLDHALAVDERIRSKLVNLRKNGKTYVGLQKEITELTNQLEAAVDRAETEDARAILYREECGWPGSGVRTAIVMS
jgi:hypothetical protein